ncbi:MAG: hypothetical protein LBD30_07755 [Verrucomicrobiales bacterium]|jgi:hypothetical protein|nr:hypothetical protein [Verrucomicrobiales bacterium]
MGTNNTFTDLDIDIIARGALKAFKNALLPLSVFSANLSPDPAQKGTTVRVLRLPAQGGTKDFDGKYDVSGSDADTVPVLINKHKYTGWYLTDKEAIGQSFVSIDTFAEAKGYDIAKVVLTDILGAVKAAKFGAPVVTVAGEDFDVDTVLEIRKLCTLDGLPDINRGLVLDTDYYTALLKELKTVSASGSTAELREGALRRLAGFNVIESCVVPANGEDLKGFACTPDALLVAMRYLQPQKSHDYFRAEAITDAETGFTLGLRQWYDNETGTDKIILEALYGFEVGNAKALKRIVDDTTE